MQTFLPVSTSVKMSLRPSKASYRSFSAISPVGTYPCFWLREPSNSQLWGKKLAGDVIRFDAPGAERAVVEFADRNPPAGRGGRGGVLIHNRHVGPAPRADRRQAASLQELQEGADVIGVHESDPGQAAVGAEGRVRAVGRIATAPPGYFSSSTGTLMMTLMPSMSTAIDPP